MEGAVKTYREKPIIFSGPMVKAILDGSKTQTRRPLKVHPALISRVQAKPRCMFRYDRLWVRESWRPKLFPNDKDIEYRADYDSPGKPWKPSIYMPRWASRITLEITHVWIERLQEISAYDILREGLECHPVPQNFRKFEILWNSLYAKKGYGWETNPWVWVISFKKIDEDKANA